MPEGMNIIDELISDHREAEQLFNSLDTLPPGDRQRRTLADQVITALVKHSIAEEMYLYPTVRQHVTEGGALADKELQDHIRAERTMKDLESRKPDDPEFDRLLTTLMREIRTHIEDEEQNLFPKLRAACTQQKLAELGEKVRRAKKTAPTRPHPAAPHTPPANKLLAPGAGLVDRLRDAMTGRAKQG